MSFLTCVIFSLIYIKTRDRVQSQVLSRQWLIAWHIGIPTLMSMVYCFAAGDEFTAVLKEVRANNYRLCSYLIAQMLIQLPVMWLLAVISTCTSGFGIGRWSLNAAVPIEVIMFAMCCIYESLAQLLAVASPHPALATMGVTTFWLLNFLFSGAIVRRDDVPWPFRVLSYILPYGYASRSAVRSEYIDETFAGAVRLPDGSYTCPGELPTGCYGVTGEEVLKSLSNVIYNMTPENKLWEDLALLIGFAVVFKILFVIVAYYRACRAMAIGAPPAEDPVEKLSKCC